jgi:putative endopeptidase
MQRARFLMLSAATLVAATPMVAQPHQQPGASAQATRTAPKFGSFGVDLTARDETVRPGQNFFLYANGTWFRNNPIPADQTAWGVSGVLREEVERQVRTIVEEAGTRAASDPIARQVSDLYASYMDEAGIEARGTGALRPYLSRIAAARTRDDLVRLFATPGFPSPVGVGITPNPADPTRYVAGANQGGLGMPNRSYYLDQGEQFDRYRAGYREYVTTMLRLAGFPEPQARADRIIALERRIAEAHWTPEQNRDVTKTVNPMTPAQLAALAPEFNWPLWTRTMRLNSVPTIIVRQPTAIQAEGRLFAEVPLDTWKDWLAFHFIRARAQFLPQAFDDAHFAFYGRTLTGAQQQRDRWSAGSMSSTAWSGRRSASSTSSATSRLRARRRWTNWSATCVPPSPSASSATAGWTKRPGARRWPSSRHSIR